METSIIEGSVTSILKDWLLDDSLHETFEIRKNF